MTKKPYRVRRCQAAVYKKDCYRVDRRHPSGFTMHYIREQCERRAVEGHKANHDSKDPFCWQHEKIAMNPGAAYPSIAGYFQYMKMSDSIS